MRARKRERERKRAWEREIEGEGERENGRPWKRSAIDRESLGAHQQDPRPYCGIRGDYSYDKALVVIPHCAPTPPPLTRWYRRIDTNVSGTECGAFVIETPRQQSDAMLTLIIDFRVHSRERERENRHAGSPADFDYDPRLFYVFIMTTNNTSPTYISGDLIETDTCLFYPRAGDAARIQCTLEHSF